MFATSFLTIASPPWDTAVLRLDVPIDEAPKVRVSDRGGHCARDAQRIVDRERPLGLQLLLSDGPLTQGIT